MLHRRFSSGIPADEIEEELEYDSEDDKSDDDRRRSNGSLHYINSDEEIEEYQFHNAYPVARSPEFPPIPPGKREVSLKRSEVIPKIPSRPSSGSASPLASPSLSRQQREILSSNNLGKLTPESLTPQNSAAMLSRAGSGGRSRSFTNGTTSPDNQASATRIRRPSAFSPPPASASLQPLDPIPPTIRPKSPMAAKSPQLSPVQKADSSTYLPPLSSPPTSSRYHQPQADQYTEEVNASYQASSSAAPTPTSAGRTRSRSNSASSQTQQHYQQQSQQSRMTTSTAMNMSQMSSDQGQPPAKINWKRGDLIGQGGFGRVYLGMNTDTGELIAVKEVVFNGPLKAVQERLANLQREIAVMKDLNHPNIVRYYGTEREGNTLYILLEFVPGGSLSSLLKRFGRLDESVVRVYTIQILRGLAYLHSNRIIHRDIKGANVLVDVTGTLKLADFGASRQISDILTVTDGFTSLQGTPHWMAPEVILQTGHGRSADIWSVACTVIEMFTGKPPFSNFTTPAAAMFHIASCDEPPEMPDIISPQARDFLTRCFRRDPKMRPTAAQLLQHPWLIEGIPPSPLTGSRSISSSASSPMTPSSVRIDPNSANTNFSTPTSNASSARRMSFNRQPDQSVSYAKPDTRRHAEYFDDEVGEEVEEPRHREYSNNNNNGGVDEKSFMVGGASVTATFNPVQEPTWRSNNEDFESLREQFKNQKLSHQEVAEPKQGFNDPSSIKEFLQRRSAWQSRSLSDQSFQEILQHVKQHVAHNDNSSYMAQPPQLESLSPDNYSTRASNNTFESRLVSPSKQPPQQQQSQKQPAQSVLRNRAHQRQITLDTSFNGDNEEAPDEDEQFEVVHCQPQQYGGLQPAAKNQPPKSRHTGGTSHRQYQVVDETDDNNEDNETNEEYDEDDYKPRMIDDRPITSFYLQQVKQAEELEKSREREKKQSEHEEFMREQQRYLQEFKHEIIPSSKSANTSPKTTGSRPSTNATRRKSSVGSRGLAGSSSLTPTTTDAKRSLTFDTSTKQPQPQPQSQSQSQSQTAVSSSSSSSAMSMPAATSNAMSPRIMSPRVSPRDDVPSPLPTRSTSTQLSTSPAKPSSHPASPAKPSSAGSGSGTLTRASSAESQRKTPRKNAVDAAGSSSPDYNNSLSSLSSSVPPTRPRRPSSGNVMAPPPIITTTANGRVK